MIDRLSDWLFIDYVLNVYLCGIKQQDECGQLDGCGFFKRCDVKRNNAV